VTQTHNSTHPTTLKKRLCLRNRRVILYAEKMSTPLLVLTSDIPFGDLIRQNLEETGRYIVRVSMEQEAAVAFARELKPPLAFLDTSLTDKELLKIGKLLKKANPEIFFVLVSEKGWPAPLEELSPRDYLSKPFYLPDLLSMMDGFFRPAKPAETDSQITPDNPENDLPWLTDVNRAAQHLTRLTLESSAQAALITLNDQLWAYAGQLPQTAAHELANSVARYWDRQEENDLVRFIRLESTDAEHMLYATHLAEGMVLALVFDAETPFSTIHTQASQLVHSLSSSSDEQGDDEEKDGEVHLTSLLGIASDLPDPYRPKNASGGTLGVYKPVDPDSLKEPSHSILSRFTRDYYPPVMDTPLVDTDQTEVTSDSPDESNAYPETDQNAYIRRTDQESIEESQSRQINPGARKIMLEPVSAAVYNLDYACLLLPRFPHHHLTGDLLEQLGEWVPHICIAFAWRLEYISVRPDYLQWIVNVPPATSPGYLMRMVRQHTSEKIFSDFPRFKNDNPSGDFWAPGYLIMGGSQPAPAQLIKDFILQTRQRQGISLQNWH
jgi:REP element-mobilizing transposase RayT/DNA-binding response OmpR family regulator